MVRLRQGLSETVLFTITGAKSIIAESMVVEAKLNQTWVDLFNRVLKLNVSVGTGLFVCTSRYCPSAPKQGEGWRSELHEQIVEFVRKFERKRKQYSVRLCDGSDLHLHGGPRGFHGNSASASSSGLGVSMNAAPALRGPTIVIATQGKVPPSMPYANGIAQKPNVGRASNGRASVVPPKTPKTPQKSSAAGRRPREPATTVTTPDESSPERRKRPPPRAPTPFSPRKRLRSQSIQSGRPNERSTGRAPTINAVTTAATVKIEPPPDVLELEPDWARNWEESDNEGSRDSGNDTDPANRVEKKVRTRLGLVRGDMDNESTCTAATTEEEELHQLGIQVENVKTTVEKRLGGMSNTFLLRLRNEYDRLRANGSWMRNVNRAPLTCFMVQEIFRK